MFILLTFAAALFHHGTVQKPPLKCTLTADSICFAGTIPQIKVMLHNQTDREIFLLGSLDGSSNAMRYPLCYFEITNSLGKTITHERTGCGTLAGLHSRFFVKVAAQGSFNPYTGPAIESQHGFAFTHQLLPHYYIIPGEYRFRFVYSSASNSLYDWNVTSASDKAAIENKMQLMPKVMVKSNEVKIFVVWPSVFVNSRPY